MTEIQNEKPYDLQDRTLLFAKDVRQYCRKYNKNYSLIWDDVRQLVRSSGFVGAIAKSNNYLIN